MRSVTTRSGHGRPPLEWAIVTAVRSLLVLLPPTTLLLLVNDLGGGRLLPVLLTHLSIVVAAGLGLTLILSARLDERWYEGGSALGERIGVVSTVVVLVTGAVGLTTLASSAALRYDPSLQFLQLLSALDIAWVTAAITIGVTWLSNRRLGFAAGLIVTGVCVWSIWSYLDAVGFGPGGGWRVDAAALFRHVLPYDMAAAVIAFTVVILGARSTSDHLTARS